MKRILTGFLAILTVVGLVVPVFLSRNVEATRGGGGVGSGVLAQSGIGIFGVDATILTGCAGADTGKGEGITCLLKLVVDVFSGIVGVLGVLGIVIVGIQYLTAGGSEEKVRKAKERLFNIVIGMALYIAMYGILNWLLPGFSGGP